MVYLPPEHQRQDTLHSAAIEYEKVRPRYIMLSEAVARIFMDSFRINGLKVQAISSRAKTVESFNEKCEKTLENGEPKYFNPLKEITDLAGVRIITYSLSDVENVVDFIEANFQIVEKKDVGEERFQIGQFGYQSIHFLVELSKERLGIIEFAHHKDLICEIQVRTVLQHVWAEIEHSVRYKNKVTLPQSIKRKFTALAGLLEIADREFRSIQDDYGRLKESVIVDLKEELTKEAIIESSEQRSEPELASQSKELASSKRVRELISEGLYEEAISIYDKKIAEQPRSFTLYIGRARARFLIGDLKAAERDLSTAGQLNPQSPLVNSLRELIVDGYAPKSSVFSSSVDSSSLTNIGNRSMREGDGEKAYNFYADAQESGASRPFSIFNKAMACVLAGDYTGGRFQLDLLSIRTGTPMEINIKALLVIIAVLEGKKIDDELRELEHLVKVKEDFSLAMSPLSILIEGMEKSRDGSVRRPLIQPIVACLIQDAS